MKNPTASPKTPAPVSVLCFGLVAVVLALFLFEGPGFLLEDSGDPPLERSNEVVAASEEAVDPVSLSTLLEEPEGDREAWLARVTSCLEGPLSAVEQEDLVAFLMAPANGTVGRRVWEEVRRLGVSRLLPGEDEGRVRFRYEPPPSPIHPLRFGPRRHRLDPYGPPG